MIVKVLTTIALAAAAVALAVVPVGASAHITGGGSGFAGPEIDQWKAETAVTPYNLSVNYVAQGSTFGRISFGSETLDFGASDITYPSFELPGLKTSKRCAGKSLHDCFVYVPVSAGGVAFMYNLTDASGHRISNLRLTRSEVCKIFSGAITQWNDPELVQTNPFLRNFNSRVAPIVRADGAGESYVLSEFCINVQPQVWKDFIARYKQQDPQNVGVDFARGDPVSNWPAFNNASPIPYADGVANAVADSSGRGTITYVAAAYAKQRNFPVASLQNAAGVYTQPDEANVTVALGYAKPNPSGDAAGTFLLNFNGPDPRAYFPSTYSYILAQRQGFNAGQGATLGLFLCYAVSAGQADAVPLRYARLSKPIVDIALAAIANIPGAPDAGHCYIAGAAPPPPPPVVQSGGPGLTGGNTDATNGQTSTGGAQPGSTASGGNGKTSATVKRVKSGHVVTVIGGSTDTTLSQETLDNQLAAAAHGTPEKHHSISGIWVLLAGAVAAWLVALIVRRRRVAT